MSVLYFKNFNAGLKLNKQVDFSAILQKKNKK